MSSSWNIWNRSSSQKGGKILKKFILGGLLCSLIFITSGCFGKNKLDNAQVYTTIYPIQYFTEVLYGTHSTVSSIYPNGADVSNYTLTDKQKNEYSKADLFIYNGSTDEKQIAKDFANKNKKLQIIDVAYGLKYKYAKEELWLSPNNALMLASNIKDSLKNFIDSKFVNEEIDDNYKKLEETLSILDAEMRNIAQTASEKGKNTIVVSSNTFRFLEDYGFEILSIEDNQTENGINVLKRNFKNGIYKSLFVKNTEEITEVINELKANGANIQVIHTMSTLSDEDKKNNETYLTIMKEFVESIKNAVLN